MALDSKVAFQARAIELGVTQVDVTALEAKGITSYATYAYCCIVVHSSQGKLTTVH